MKLVTTNSRFHIEKCVGCKTCTHVCPTIAYTPSFDRPLEKAKVAPCSSRCPIGNDIEGFLFLIAQERYQEAYQLLLRTNPLPGITGRVCHAPCEEACNRSEFDEGISIQALERFVADRAAEKGQDGVKPRVLYQEKVAVIGSGPAGLSCAYHLARSGYRVTVFEAEKRPGGLLRYGIPEYRLPKKRLEWEIERIRSCGVKFQLNKRLGKTLKLGDLKGFGAVFIATGLQKHRSLRIPGENIEGVWNARDFLAKTNFPRTLFMGRKVAVIGGGNSAVDSARSALRLGAQPVLIYRRSIDEMPALLAEREELEREGIQILSFAMPERIIAKEGRVQQIECSKTRPGEIEKDGRRIPLSIPGSNFILDVDAAIVAAVEMPDLSPLPVSLRAEKDILVVDADGTTKRKGFFAGGDIATGAGTVSEAIASGMKGAFAIDRFLRKEAPRGNGPCPEIVGFEDLNPDYFYPSSKIPSGRLDLLRRISSFEEVRLGYPEEAAIQEAQRCFACGAPPRYHVENCRGCSNCEQRCPASAITIERLKEPFRISIDPGSFPYDEIVRICHGAKIHPRQTVCYCTNTTAEEIAAAILSGANTPEAVSRMTGARTGCTVLCVQSIVKLLEVSGQKVSVDRTHQCYGRTFTLWDVETGIRERYKAGGYHFEDDQELIEKALK